MLETHGVGHEHLTLSSMQRTHWSACPHGRMAGDIVVCCHDSLLASQLSFEDLVPGCVVVVHINGEIAT